MSLKTIYKTFFRPNQFSDQFTANPNQYHRPITQQNQIQPCHLKFKEILSRIKTPFKSTLFELQLSCSKQYIYELNTCNCYSDFSFYTEAESENSSNQSLVDYNCEQYASHN